MAQTHKAAWLRTSAAPAGGEGALIVSHGGAIEPALVACLPGADHASWGALFAHCDGARLAISEGIVTDVEFDRAPALPGEQH